MDLSYFFFGYYEIGIKAEDFKRFFGICTFHGISFLKMNLSECEEETNTCFCRIRCDRYERLKEIAKKTNVELTIVKKHGFPVLIEYIKLHIWFLIGAVTALFLLIGLSRRIWDIQVDGNEYYGFEQFQRFLETEEIRSGIRMSDVNCMDLSAAVRENFTKVTWASSEIDGCKLIIHIKENVITESEISASEVAAYDLVSDKDGIIEEILVRKGVAQVEIGQSVEKGDLLISGWIPIKNDAAEVVAQEAVESDGDVKISCEYSYYDEIEREWLENQIIEENNLPVFQIGDYRFEMFWPTFQKNSENNEQFVEKIYIERKMKITDTFLLPVRIGTCKQLIYEKNPQNYTDSQLKEIAENRFQEFCTNLEKKGVQIYQNNVKMVISDVSCVMSGKISVIEKIGVLKQSQTQDDYGIESEE